MTTPDAQESRALAALLLVAFMIAACSSSSSSSVEDDDGGTNDAVLDLAQPDVPLLDAAGKDHAPDQANVGPLAKVYLVNPIEDNEQTTEVTLTAITDEAGALTGEWANAYNCLNTEGGDAIDIELGSFKLEGAMCKLEKSVLPGSDGSYLHVEPSSGNDPDDPFAELMMYHHVTSVHDRFKDRLGIDHVDKSLRAIVNIQFYAEVMGGWVGMTNAAFVPKASGGFLQAMGIDLTNGEDAIIFFQGDSNDTAYDASVIYHEYTHAVIGTSLVGLQLSPYGLDPSAGGINEGLADYFAASFLETGVVGSYALGPFDAQRDLTRPFGCPEHLVGEVHWDGEIVAGAVWTIRQQIGAAITDQAVANTVLTLTGATTFSEFAAILLAEIKSLDASKESEAAAILSERGLTECVPLLDHEDYDHTAAQMTRSPSYPGTAEAPMIFGADGVPSYLQHRIDVAPTTKQISIEFVAQGRSLGFMPAAPGNLSVALKRGSAPITYDYSGATATSDADAVFEPTEANGTTFSLTVAGSCISDAGLVLQFRNKSQTGGEIRKLSITQSDTSAEGYVAFDCPE